jgi:OPT family oligopeptide transporter
VLRYPLVVPPGAALTFDLGQKTGPDTPMQTETLKAEFPEGATFADEKALLAGLNGATLAGGAANPFSGKVAFTVRRSSLTATASHLTQWDAELSIAESQGAAALGFAAGQRRAVPYGGFRNVVRWLMWPGVAMMVTAGLLSFFMQWRTVLRAFSGIAAMFKKGPSKTGADPLAAVEVPGSWFATGVVLTGIAAVVLQIWFFGIHWWMGVLAVIMSFFLAIVACRATGETDITPVGAMGKITQLMYGGIAPGNMTANLMTANVTAGAATSSADLLQALRCGFMVGASPRKQFLVMLLGVVVGAAVSAPVYNILVPSADVLGTDKLPAPAAQTWAGVALLLSNGLHALPVSARWGLLCGGLLGIVITLCERQWPKSRKFLPSATAMGIAFVIPAYNSVSMFFGALIAWMIEKRANAFGETYTIPVASGLIAGESLMGIAVAMFVAFQLL